MPNVYMILLSIMIKLPAPHPFTDWEWIPSSVRCWAEGVDVYVNNTCFKSGDNLAFNYSPLWLRLSFLGLMEKWVNVTAIGFCLLFFLSPAIYDQLRNRRTQEIAILTMLSSGTILGVERGNADILLFLIIVVALMAMQLKSMTRFIGYGLLIFAGLLKFYPFIGLVIAARDRSIVVVCVAIASISALAVLALTYQDKISVMANNLPGLSIYTLQFGAGELPSGLGAGLVKLLTNSTLLNAEAARAYGRLVTGVLQILLPIGSLLGAVLVCRAFKLPSHIAQLNSLTRDSLVVGVALIVGCFFVSQSVIYRGIFLLLVLPGLATLRVSHEHLARLIKLLEIGIVFVLWIPFIETMLFLLGATERQFYQADPTTAFPPPDTGLILWLADELVWWGLITAFLAILGAFLVRSDIMGVVVGRHLRPVVKPGGSAAYTLGPIE